MATSLNDDLCDLLERVEEFLDGQVDVIDGPGGQPLPDEAMRLSADIKDVLSRLAANPNLSPVFRAALGGTR